MKRKTRKALTITADHAARALHALIAEGKLAARDVLTALKRREKLIKELRDRFTALESEAVPAIARARKSVSRKPARKIASASGAKARTKSRRQGNRAGVKRRETKSAAAARVTRGESSIPSEPTAARTATRLAGTGTRTTPVKVRTKTVSKKTSIMTEPKPKPRPRTSITARGADGHALPDPKNPGFEAGGPAARQP